MHTALNAVYVPWQRFNKRKVFYYYSWQAKASEQVNTFFCYYPQQCFETGHLWAHACHVKLGRNHMHTPPHQQRARHDTLATTTAWRMGRSALLRR
ncbi:hypothetical protein L798_10377 [Zootermopsis nevadensis]|uniref:Uncharacterized protein n=1 Tax=Zootermopsis nevadensis TaxID=136037 RepID=A0A067R733_ZOONE|nr:hypothetical protein L798_10377 [Zootermopsis nevadensis]